MVGMKRAETYHVYRRAKKHWESPEAEGSKFKDKYVDERGVYRFTGDMERSKRSAIRGAEREAGDAIIRTRLWAPGETIEGTFRKHMGKKCKKRGRVKGMGVFFDKGKEITICSWCEKEIKNEIPVKGEFGGDFHSRCYKKYLKGLTLPTL
jgi:hypothetical protein